VRHAPDPYDVQPTRMFTAAVCALMAALVVAALVLNVNMDDLHEYDQEQQRREYVHPAPATVTP
jgi:hypothetical protein